MPTAHEPVMFSEVVHALKAGQEIPHSVDCTHVTKDRLESSGEQMYRLSTPELVRFPKYDVQGGLVGEACELVLSDLQLKIGEHSELHGITEVYDQSGVLGSCYIVDSLIKGSSLIQDAAVSHATIDQSVISAGSYVYGAILKNVKAGPHTIIDGGGSPDPLALEDVEIPGFVVIDRPGQVHQLPYPWHGYPSAVAIDTNGNKVLGGQFFRPIRGIEAIRAYMEENRPPLQSWEQWQENIRFVNSLTLPAK